MRRPVPVPTTEQGRRVQGCFFVAALFLMGFFTFGGAWILLIVLLVLDQREQATSAKVSGGKQAPTLTGTWPTQSRFPDDFPGFKKWCAARNKRIGFDETPEHCKRAMETGNPGYLPTYMLHEFYATPAYKAWKQQQQQQQQ